MVALRYGGGIRRGGGIELFDLEGALEFEEEGAVWGVEEGGEGVSWESGCRGRRWVEGDGWHLSIYYRLVLQGS